VSINSVYGRNLLPFRAVCLRLCLIFFSGFYLILAHPSKAQEFIRIDSIEFTGLKKTRNEIALREIPFRSGGVLPAADTSGLFRQACNNLMNTRLFHSCSVELLEFTPGDSAGHQVKVVFHLLERWYTTPIPVLELADRSFNEWWYDRGRDFRRVNAGLSILQKNVRGRNEDLLIGAQTGFTKRLDFSYFIPYLDRKQIFGLRLQAIYLVNKEVAVRSLDNRLLYIKDEDSFGRQRLQAGIQLLARKNMNLYHSLELNFHSYRISPFIFGLNPDYFLGETRQQYSEGRYTLTMDYRNYRRYASKGWLAVFRASRIGLFPGDDFRLWSIMGNLAFYQPISKNFFWASRLDGEMAENKKLPYLGSRTLGYENRFVRGYERNVLEGNASVFLRNSLRFKFFEKVWREGPFRPERFRHFPLTLYLNAFTDAGYMHSPFGAPENSRLLNTPLLGYGAGIHALTVYDLVFRLEYTMNRQGGSGFYFSILTDI